MAYWLLKSERETWSWDQQKESGRKGAEWTGVRNYQARNNMRAMKDGDLGFFYLSGGDKSVVGIVDLPKPVTLAEIKANPKLAGMVLVRNSRLSVQPVSPTEWSMICKLGGLAKPPQA